MINEEVVINVEGGILTAINEEWKVEKNSKSISEMRVLFLSPTLLPTSFMDYSYVIETRHLAYCNIFHRHIIEIETNDLAPNGNISNIEISFQNN